jgi:hypothetical protein
MKALVLRREEHGAGKADAPYPVFSRPPAQETSAVNLPSKQSKWRDSPVVALPCTEKTVASSSSRRDYALGRRRARRLLKMRRPPSSVADGVRRTPQSRSLPRKSLPL